MNQNQFEEIIRLLNTHSTIEIVYYISNIIIAFASIVALWQLKLYKANQKIIATRDSITLSAMQVQRYCDEIIPQINKLDTMIHSKPKKKYSGPVLRESKFIDKAILAWIQQFNPDELEQFLNVINSLEALSIYFIKGVADEETAFYPLGESFVNDIKKYSPIIAVLRTNDNAPQYSSLFKLYDLWSQKSLKDDLSKKVNELKGELNKLHPNSIKPIGV